MSESVEVGRGYQRVQYSTFVNGDQVVIRCDNGEELKEIAQSVADSAEDALKAINAFKQTFVANGVFTGDSSKKGATLESGKRAADSPPPVAATGVPTCEHGPMDDLRGKGYKSDFYCTLKTNNWREKCKPIKAS